MTPADRMRRARRAPSDPEAMAEIMAERGPGGCAVVNILLEMQDASRAMTTEEYVKSLVDDLEKVTK